MRRAARIDTNHREIVQALREIGASVQTLAACGHGVPDVLVGYRGQNHLLEIKRPAGARGGTSHREPTEDQHRWLQAWRGRAVIVRSVEDALCAVGATRRIAAETSAFGSGDEISLKTSSDTWRI